MRAKDLHIAMKCNNPAEELMTRFGFATREDLYDSIKVVVPQAAKEFIRKIERKSGSKSARVSSKEKNVPLEEKVEVAVSLSEIHSVEATIGNEENEVVVSEKSRENELQQLQNDEQELSGLLCNLESEHKAIVARRMEVTEQLRTSKAHLQKILVELEREQGNITAFYDEYNKLARRMQEISHECATYRELISDVRNRIDELKMAYIVVFADGSIEVENAEMVSIVYEEMDAVFKDIVNRREAEDLLVKELKAIARLKVMVKEYEKSGIKVEIDFENSKAKQLFECNP